jgi:hypothetical protein
MQNSKCKIDFLKRDEYKVATATASDGGAIHRLRLTTKNADSEVSSRRTRKSPPQFA